MANPEAGARFEEYVRVALARSKTIHTVAELLRSTGLHPNTLYDLFNGTTNEPGPRTMALVAKALEVPIGDLWAAWQGLEIAPDSIEQALREHTLAVDRQNELLGELVGFIRTTAAAIIAPVPPSDDPLLARAAEAIRSAEESAAYEQPRNRSRRRRSDRPGAADERRGSLEGEAG